MVKRKNVAVVLVVMLVVSLLSSQAWAAWGKGNRGGKPDRQKITAAIAKRLNLTQEQIDKLKAEEQGRQKTIEAGRQKIKELGDKLKQELAKDAPDRNAVHDLIARIGAQTTQLQITRTDSLLKLRETLTPGQKEKFKEMLDRKDGRMHPNMGGNRH
jgi:Spy/CpxP family protein refolding chaperone